jgi:hypothetical protein
MGLDLSSAAGLAATAIQRVAHQTETGPSGGRILENPSRFGVAMPIIDPGRPSNSYLAYKILIGRAIWDNGSCTTRYSVDLAGQCPGPSEAERQRLEEWFVAGAPMPPGQSTLDPGDLALLRDWIAGGATLEECD